MKLQQLAVLLDQSTRNYSFQMIAGHRFESCTAHHYHELIYAFGRLSMGGDPIPSSIRNTVRMDAHWDDTWLRNDCY